MALYLLKQPLEGDEWEIRLGENGLPKEYQAIEDAMMDASEDEDYAEAAYQVLDILKLRETSRSLTQNDARVGHA